MLFMISTTAMNTGTLLASLLFLLFHSSQERKKRKKENTSDARQGIPTLTGSSRAELVNHATRLLFHLTSNYANQIDLQAKLRVIPGGTHKYLVGLTRLAFSEGVFFERGIDEDVAECAHQMLETLVNPQEAEALLEAFSTAKK